MSATAASLSGRCLCGAVRIEAPRPTEGLSACHCEMCRRWTGSMLLGFEVPADDVRVEGPVQRHASSAIGERAWCATCGSALWFRTLGDGAGTIELCSGLFDDAAGLRLEREVYADRCPQGYAFAGGHQRVSAADYERSQPHIDTGSAT